MLVYIEVASEMKRRDPGGRVRVDSRSTSSFEFLR